jgi:DNA-binding NarL/FixJ family response regulator
MDRGLISVLLIEDNVNYRKTLAELIDQNEKMVCKHAFESCEEALDALEEGLAPDIILLDIGLPGMSGIEGISYIKAISPSSQIIIITIYDDNENIIEAIGQGASGYLLKSAPAEDIIQSITDVVDGGAPINPHIAKKMLSMFNKISLPPKNYGLTEREKELLKILTEGLTKKQIAAKLFISYHTVDTHLKNIYTKLQVQTRSGVVAKAIQENLI